MNASGLTLALSFWALAAGGVDADPGPVGDWDFREGAGGVLHDRSGNGIDGTIRDAQWVKLAQGHVLKFDGAKSRVEFAAGPSLDLTDAVTLETWICPSATSAGEAGVAGKAYDSYLISIYHGRLVRQDQADALRL